MTQDNSSAQLVERLREFEGSDDLGNGDFSLLNEAADMIEALTRVQPSTELDVGAQQADGRD